VGAHRVRKGACVLAELPRFLSVLSLADRHFRHQRPDAVVLIDYPGLHWWLARRARFHHIPVFYFVPPQIWAWATHRVARMRRYVDHVLCTLPFERDWYAERGVTAEYVGHPYFDQMAAQVLDAEFVAAERQRGGRIVALLPGSRTKEVKHNLESMLRAARQVADRHRDVRFLVAAFKESQAQFARQMLASFHLPVDVHVGRTPEIIHLAQACLAVSGSVSLELLWHARPTVIVYRIGAILHRLVRRFNQSKYITLVNLLADRELFPEYLTDHCPANEVAGRLRHWLEDEPARQRLVADLEQLRSEVARPGACATAAAFMLDRLAGRRQLAA
ncbi:MAG TPA: lipid-A-disaccharide synthetase, partial [Gemmatales bacterium]|nr:lipid-A-disaccharide synthetase [Gemmatales bacterium]